MSEPCYSPSRGGTQDFQRCPRLYDLNKRWTPEFEWKPEIAMGNAIHAGLAERYRDYLTGDGDEPDKVALYNLGGHWLGDQVSEMPIEAAGRIVGKCLGEALKVDLLGSTGRVVAVEQEMGPEQCHPDLVIAHNENWLQVIDWKFSLTLKPEWVAKRLASYETLWQLWHYAWRVQQEFGLPCKQITVVQMAGLPKAFAKRVDYEVTPALLKAWEAGARQWWALMASGFNAPNFDGCRKYGENYLCWAYDGCHRLAADESKFDTLYRRKA